jgi:hypothetical protein
MNKSLKVLAGITLLTLIAFPLGGVFATDSQNLNTNPDTPIGGVTPEGVPNVSATGMIQLIRRIVNWVFTALLAVVFVMILVAAFMFVTGGGNPDNVTKARQILIMALVGFAVAMLAQGIVALVSAILGGSGSNPILQGNTVSSTAYPVAGSPAANVNLPVNTPN